MKKRVLITGVYSGSAIKVAIAKLSLDKLVLVLEKDFDSNKSKECVQKNETVKNLKEQFKNILEMELLKTDSVYNIYNIAEEVIKKIDKIPTDNEIFIHVSEGTKTLSFALNLAAHARKERISSIYYIIKETNEIMKLPTLHFPEINKTQESILHLIKKNVNNPHTMMKELDKSKSVVYQSIKELQKKEYIEFDEEQVALTPLGKIKVI